MTLCMYVYVTACIVKPFFGDTLPPVPVHRVGQSVRLVISCGEDSVQQQTRAAARWKMYALIRAR